MKGRLYLLDTSALVNIVRGNDLGKFIQQTYDLLNPATRPLISVVSHGELWAMAARRNWQRNKRQALQQTIDAVVTIDLNAGEIITAYVEVDKLSQTVAKGARTLSKNDLWIAATAKASNAALLTTDQDFLFLHPHYLFVEYVDPRSKLAIPTLGNQPKAQ